MTLETLTDSELTATLAALALLLASAFLVGTLLEKAKAPRVVGEIMGGLLLGGKLPISFFPGCHGKHFSGIRTGREGAEYFLSDGLNFPDVPVRV